MNELLMQLILIWRQMEKFVNTRKMSYMLLTIML